MGGHTKPLPVQANESHSISLGKNAMWSSTPLMPVVLIREDMDHCPVPLIYKRANMSPPELGFLRSREDGQMRVVPNHFSVACRVVREQGHCSYSITHCAVWIINHPVSWRWEAPEECGSPFNMCGMPYTQESVGYPACLWREPSCLGCCALTPSLDSIHWTGEIVFEAWYHDSHMTPGVNPSSDSDSDHTNELTSCLEIEMSHRLLTWTENVLMVTDPL